MTAARHRWNAYHLLVALLLVGVDFGLTTQWARAGYGVRALAALCIGFLIFPPAKDRRLRDLPAWGNVLPSLRWTGRFLLAAVPILFVLSVALVAAIKTNDWTAALFPITIKARAEAASYILQGLVIAPLLEELIYRGCIYPRLRAGAGIGLAVFLSGPIFWLLHWVYHGTITPLHHLAAGWILAWAFERTKSLLAPTLLHALGNLLLLLLDLLYFNFPEWFRGLHS